MSTVAEGSPIYLGPRGVDPSLSRLPAGALYNDDWLLNVIHSSCVVSFSTQGSSSVCCDASGVDAAVSLSLIMARPRMPAGPRSSSSRVLVVLRTCVGSCILALMCAVALFLNADGYFVWHIHVVNVSPPNAAMRTTAAADAPSCAPRIIAKMELQSLLQERSRSKVNESQEEAAAPLWWEASGAACVPSDPSLPWLVDDGMHRMRWAAGKPAALIRTVNGTDQSETTWWRLRRGRHPLVSLRTWSSEHPVAAPPMEATFTWSECEVWLASSVPNLYDLWNDVLLPLQHDLLSGAAVPRQGELPCIHVVVLPTPHHEAEGKGWVHHTTGLADAMRVLLGGLWAINTTLLDLHRGSGGHYGASPQLRRYACYRSSRWYGAAAVLSLPSGSRIVHGDADRQRASLALKRRIVALSNLMPYDQDAIDALPPRLKWAQWLRPLVSFVHVPGANVLSMQPDSPWASSSGNGCRPRALLVLRNASRVLGDADAIVAMAKSIGFAVAAVYMESPLSAAAQAHASRYADLMMGVHGQGLAWMALMDGVSVPHCRHVVELRHFGRPLRGVHNVYEMMAADHHLRYLALPPSHVTFDPVRVPPHRRQSAMQRLMRQSFPQGLVAFDAQTVYYDTNTLRHVLRHVYGRLRDCVCNGATPPPPAAWEVELSGVVH